MKRLIGLAGAGALAWLLLCGTAIAVPPGETGFRLGVINERPDKPDHALDQYQLLHTYLSRTLQPRGVRVDKLVIARGVDDMADRLLSGDVDAVIEGVMPTLTIQRQTDRLDPTLLVWRKGQRQYHSVFFVRDDSPLNRLQDLRGKTITFEAPRSTSAYFVPRLALQHEGLQPVSAESAVGQDPDTVRFIFAGSELNQAYWVHRGLADAGAFNNGDWERVPATIRRELRIIHATRPLLRWLLSFDRDLDAFTRAQVTEVLVQAHRNAVGRAALQAAAAIAKIEVLGDEDRASLAYWDNLLKLEE